MEHNYKLVFDNKNCLIMGKLYKYAIIVRDKIIVDNIFKLTFA